MPIRYLGSGLRVSELCLGTMTFGEDWMGKRKARERQILRAVPPAGGNFAHANFYTKGTSETCSVSSREVIARHCMATSTRTQRRHDPMPRQPAQEYGAGMRGVAPAPPDRLQSIFYWMHIWDQSCARRSDAWIAISSHREGAVHRVSNTPAVGGRADEHAGRAARWTRFVVAGRDNLIDRDADASFCLWPLRWGSEDRLESTSGGLLTGKYLDNPSATGSRFSKRCCASSSSDTTDQTRSARSAGG